MKDAALGIEFGSTRIKAVMTDKSGKIVAEGSHTWENELIDEDGKAELTCHFCRTSHRFSRQDLTALLERASK